LWCRSALSIVYGHAIPKIMHMPILHDTDVPYASCIAANLSPFAGVTVMDSPIRR
jgi:hypothetical protein